MDSTRLTAPTPPASPGVGVVIPVFNRPSTLLATLPSVVGQTVPPARLVIVDDGSTDATADDAERWLRQEQPPFAWKVVRNPHRGPSAARNTGLAEIDSLPFVAFLDSDDQWPPDFIERASTALVDTTDAVAASSDRRFLYAPGKVRWTHDMREFTDDPVCCMFRRGAGVASCTLFRTDAIRTAGRWPEELDTAEDFKLFVAVAGLGRWLHIAGEPVSFGRTGNCAEAGNLSRIYGDRYARWATVYESVYREIRKTVSVKRRRSLCTSISKMWQEAASDFVQLGRRSEARVAATKAAVWRPVRLSCWLRIATLLG